MGDELKDKPQEGSDPEPKPQEGGKPDKPAEQKERTYTEAELNSKIDEVVKQKKAEWKKKADDEKSEAERLAGLNAEERAKEEAKKLKDELEKLKNKQALDDMAKEARSMLRDEGINLGDALLYKIIDVNAEDTKQLVGDFTQLFNEAVEARVAERLKRTPPPADKTPGQGKSRGAQAAIDFVTEMNGGK